jgi:hypothetical protein
VTPAVDALDDLSLRIGELETTVIRAGDALRTANQTIARLTYQREAILLAATELAHEMRTQSWFEAGKFLDEIDALRDMAKETPPWTMPT